MKWIKFSLSTTTQAVDLVSNMLNELGIEGIQIEDQVPISEEDKKAMFIDILPELGPDDGIAIVSSYLKPEWDIPVLIETVKKGLKDLEVFVDVGSASITLVETDDKDWINNWKAFFKPFRVAEDIVIKPTWEKIDEVRENDLIIEIDPGTAFGTGSHETTKLGILGLRKYITADTKLLDVGCGSGILSIIGLKLGAKFAVGTDIDSAALIATSENVQVNGITSETFTSYFGDIIKDKGLQKEIGLNQYDIAVANILADVIIPLSAEIGKLLKPNGLFISSGIIEGMKDQVLEAILSNGFEIIETNQMKDWVSFVARKT
jgi:ribosomal protein L11 methyltransferase